MDVFPAETVVEMPESFCVKVSEEPRSYEVIVFIAFDVNTVFIFLVVAKNFLFYFTFRLSVTLH